MNKTPQAITVLGTALALMVLLAPLVGCGDDTTTPKNSPPRIVDIVINPASVVLGGTAQVTGLISDPDHDPVTIRWEASGGTFTDSTTSSTSWTAPQTPGTYILSLTVTDGKDTTDRAAEVIAGNASLTVISDPPGVLLDLDGSPTGIETPHTFDPLAAGFHIVVISNLDFGYDRTFAQVELQHGSADTLRFRYRESSSAPIRLGRDDLLEIGGLAYLNKGTGVVYAGRTTEGTGLFNSAINAPTGSPNGIQLAINVRVEEPVTVSADGTSIVYVSTSGLMMVATVRDTTGNGIVDEVIDIRALANQPRYGPALSPLDRLAYTRTPSNEPPRLFLTTSQFMDTLIVGDDIATTTWGRKPAWSPDGSDLAYEFEGVILYTTVIPGTPIPSDTLATGGFNTSPAWGRWGDNHLVMLRGDEEAALDRVMLGSVRSDHQVPVHTGLTDPRYLAWSPTQVTVAVSHNPGDRGEILLLFNLPVP